MVEGHVPAAILMLPAAVVHGNAQLRGHDLLSGDAAQANDDLGIYEGNLVFQVGIAQLLLLGEGVPVSGGTAFDDIGDIAVLPGHIDDGEHIVQQLPCRAHEGDALQVLLLPGALADEHELTVPVAHAEDYVVTGLAQVAVPATQAGLLQSCPIQLFHVSGSFFCSVCGGGAGPGSGCADRN